MLTETTKLVTAKRAGGWMLAGCAVMALGSSGCRSTGPGMNLFGKRSEPSAAALAGSGPTVTYPAPPSAGATPEAIASIAGGTAIAVSPGEPEASRTEIAGFESPATSGVGTEIGAATNLAAAQANGFSPPAQPAGYAFGAKAFTPKPEPTAPPAADVSAYATSTSFTPPPSNYAIPNKDTAPQATSTTGASGFTLPAGMSPALAAASTAPEPSPAVDASTGFAPPTVPVAGVALPESTPPSFSTAGVSEAIRAPSTSLSPPLPSNTSSGYSPGSTAGAVSYPGSGGGSPASSGSFYR